MKGFSQMELDQTLRMALEAALAPERFSPEEDPVVRGLLVFLTRRWEEARKTLFQLPEKTLFEFYQRLGARVPDPRPARTMAIFDLSPKAKEPLVLERGFLLGAGELVFETEEEILVLPGGFKKALFFIPDAPLLSEAREILNGQPLNLGELKAHFLFSLKARIPLDDLCPGETFDLELGEVERDLTLELQGKGRTWSLFRERNGLFKVPEEALPLEDDRGPFFWLSMLSKRPLPFRELSLIPGERKVTHLFVGDRPLSPGLPVYYWIPPLYGLEHLSVESLAQVLYPSEEQRFSLKNPFGLPPLPGLSLYLGGFWLLPGTRWRLEGVNLQSSHLCLEYFDGKSWRAFESSVEVTFPPEVKPCVVNQIRARWLRVRYVGPLTTFGEEGPQDYFLNFTVHPSQEDLPLKEIFVSNLGEETRVLPQQVPHYGLKTKEAALFLALEKAFPGGPVSLYFSGKAPREILKRLEVSTESGFLPLAFEDTTCGLKRAGRLKFFLPEDLSSQEVFGQEGVWLRLVFEKEGAHELEIRGLFLNAVPVREGQSLFLRAQSRGLPGESFSLKPLVEEVRVKVGGRSYQVVDDLTSYGPEDEVVALDPETGLLFFGDGLHGRIPPLGAPIEIHYRSHHGAQGNLPPESLEGPLSSLAFLEGVRQPEPAVGGKDRVEDALVLRRLPKVMRHRQRAFTSPDLEDLLREEDEIHRLFFLVQGGRLVLYVLPFAKDPTPLVSEGLREKIRERLEPVLPLTLRDFEVNDPLYVPLDVSVELLVASGVSPRRALEVARKALERFLHPVTGNFQAEGFAFGQLPMLSDFYRLLQELPEVRAVKRLAVMARVKGERRPYREGRPPRLPAFVLPAPGEFVIQGEPDESQSPKS